jgi:hypothetical protein
LELAFAVLLFSMMSSFRSHTDGGDPMSQYMDYSNTPNPHEDEDDEYVDIHRAVTTSEQDSITVVTAAHIANHSLHEFSNSDDATLAIHEMHLALLFLLSHPIEFERVLQQHYLGTSSRIPNNSGTTPTSLSQWNADYGDNESLYTESDSIQPPASSPQHRTQQTLSRIVEDAASPLGSTTAINTSNATTPLPFAIFCDDAEIVLPQAHTASQLFGIETCTGIELEAAAGIVSIAQLFLRWLGNVNKFPILHVPIVVVVLTVSLALVQH